MKAIGQCLFCASGKLLEGSRYQQCMDCSEIHDTKWMMEEAARLLWFNQQYDDDHDELSAEPENSMGPVSKDQCIDYLTEEIERKEGKL